MPLKGLFKCPSSPQGLGPLHPLINENNLTFTHICAKQLTLTKLYLNTVETVKNDKTSIILFYVFAVWVLVEE